MNEMLNNIYKGDAEQLLSYIPDNFIDLVLTDPPYFYASMNNEWDSSNVMFTHSKHILYLPENSRVNDETSNKFYEWSHKMASSLYRVIKPGGYYFSFCSARLYHRMASAIDNAGFTIRDCFMWLYGSNQPKAMSQDHFVDKSNLSSIIKDDVKNHLRDWKTPQLRSGYEPIVMAQKPCEGTFWENMMKYNVGMVNTKIRIGNNKFPSNTITTEKMNPIIDKYFLIPRPDINEKGDFNSHPTVKPLAICDYIIKLITYDSNAVVLDPCSGSGTTLVAAKNLGRYFIGFDINQEYIDIALKRLSQIDVPDDEIIINKQMEALY
jgi:site-specific DNA-methyltransferase (adenine-specific)